MKTYKLKIIYGYVLIVNPTANCQTSNGVETSKLFEAINEPCLKVPTKRQLRKAVTPSTSPSDFQVKTDIHKAMRL